MGKASGKVIVLLDDKSLSLALDFNAACVIEDEFGGESIVQLLAGIAAAATDQTLKVSDVRRVLWAVLRQSKPDAALQDAGRLKLQDGGAALDVLMALIEASDLFPEVEDADGAEDAANPPQGALAP